MAAQKRRAQTVNDDPNQFSQSDFRICTHIVTEHDCDDVDDDDGNGQRQEGRSEMASLYMRRDKFGN